MIASARTSRLRLQLVAASIGLLAWRAQPVRAWAQETPEEARRMADSLFEGKFAIDDADPQASVPSAAARQASPIDFGTWLMEVTERAERARQRGDHAAVVRYFAAVAQAVPERALSHSQLCGAYEAAGMLDKALTACAEALRRDGVTFGDYTRYLRLVLAQPGELPTSRVRDLDALLSHLQTQAVDPLALVRLRCDVGVRLLDVERLRACISELERRAPNDPKTLGYAFALAVREQDADAAARIVESAKHSSMRPEVVAAMERASVQLRPWPRLLAALRRQLSLIVGVLVIACAIAVYASRIRRARTNSRAHRQASATHTLT